MNKVLILLVLSLCTSFCYAQTEQRSVLDSDMSNKYKQAVHNNFYKTLNNYSGLEPGYHGFADFGYTIGIADYDFGRFEINTSHGYQCNPYLYVGGGIGWHFMSKYATPHMDIPLDTRNAQIDIPVFANIRWTCMNAHITPFVDGKVGYYVTHSGGIYTNVSAGCRFYIYGHQAISISVGYTKEDLEFQTFDRFTSHSNLDYIRNNRKLGTEGISMKIGYEF